MTKDLRKKIMKRSKLNVLAKIETTKIDTSVNSKKLLNLMKIKSKNFESLNVKSVADNKTLWKVIQR